MYDYYLITWFYIVHIKDKLNSLCFHATIHVEEMVELLRPHYMSLSEYLLAFLQKKDVKFQQLVIITILNLKKGIGSTTA